VAIRTTVILFTLSMTILTDVRRLTVGALHETFPQIISLFCNAKKVMELFKELTLTFSPQLIFNFGCEQVAPTHVLNRGGRGVISPLDA
jgi:hypothetical protein